MLDVIDNEKYRRHREARTSGSSFETLQHEILLPVLLFGSIGAITWAIRGSNGWGGIDGTILPGMTWGLLWYYLCYRKGIDAREIPLWLGLGIAIGGELGYGQYVSWIRGLFNVGDEIIDVAPWIGWVWFVLAGIGWGATGAIALGWALGGKASPERWLFRLVVPAGIAYLGLLTVRESPAWFFPNYGLGIYAVEADEHLGRTVYTNTQNFTVVAWWLGALLVALFQKDRATLTVGLLVGGGFGAGFALGALWCLGYGYAPTYIDWWKMWELNAGFNLGLLYVIALNWSIRQVDNNHDADGRPLADIGGLPEIPDRRRNLSLLLSVYLLLFITFRGVSLTVGGLLGFYDANTVEQYSWPPAREALFLPAAALLTGITILNVWRIVRSSAPAEHRRFGTVRLPERLTDLMAGMTVVGAISIWPAKISVLYALFLCVALFAFNRLNRHYDGIDAPSAG